MAASFTSRHYIEVASVVRAKLNTHEHNSAGFHAVSGVAEGLAAMFAADNERFDRLQFARACGLEADSTEARAVARAEQEQRTEDALSELDALEARIPTQEDKRDEMVFKILRQIRNLRRLARQTLVAPGATEADHANAKRLEEAHARAEAIITDYTED